MLAVDSVHGAITQRDTAVPWRKLFRDSKDCRAVGRGTTIARWVGRRIVRIIELDVCNWSQLKSNVLRSVIMLMMLVTARRIMYKII